MRIVCFMGLLLMAFSCSDDITVVEEQDAYSGKPGDSIQFSSARI